MGHKKRVFSPKNFKLKPIVTKTTHRKLIKSLGRSQKRQVSKDAILNTLKQTNLSKNYKIKNPTKMREKSSPVGMLKGGQNPNTTTSKQVTKPMFKIKLIKNSSFGPCMPPT